MLNGTVKYQRLAGLVTAGGCRTLAMLAIEFMHVIMTVLLVPVCLYVPRFKRVAHTGTDIDAGRNRHCQNLFVLTGVETPIWALDYKYKHTFDV